jgi:hypothetical protein
LTYDLEVCASSDVEQVATDAIETLANAVDTVIAGELSLARILNAEH